MSRPSACPIVLSTQQRQRLEHRTRAATAQHRHVLRAMIVVLAAQGVPNSGIAQRVGVCVDTARTWRKRYAVSGEDGLRDRARPGRPRRFTDVQQAQVKALACELPADRGIPLSRFSHADLAAEAADVGSWIFPRDPDFAAKAGRVLDLYARTWQGEALGPNDYVISADETTHETAPSSDPRRINAKDH